MSGTLEISSGYMQCQLPQAVNISVAHGQLFFLLPLVYEMFGQQNTVYVP